MKKKSSRNNKRQSRKDLIINMLPSGRKAPLPPMKRKKKTPTQMAVNQAEERFRMSIQRSHAFGSLAAPQFALPLSDGIVAPGKAGGEIIHIQGSKKEGMEVKAGFDIQAGNTVNLMPFFHTPGNAQDAYNLPKTFVEQIRWSRLMYNLNPYIGAITDLRAYYALSKFKITTPEPAVTEFYTQVAFNKKFNLYEFLLRVSLSIQKFGEAIVWGARKQDGVWPKTGKPRWVWDYFILLEPELVEIKKSLVGNHEPKYFLRPSRDMEELVDKIESGDEEYRDYASKIPEKIRERIKKKELIQIDDNTISAIQNLTDASATRGTPPYQRLFTTFILEDFTRLAQAAQANRYHFPVELWTLGDLDKNILPTTEDLEQLRSVVTDAIQAPPASLFLPPIVKYEALGVQGKTFPFKDDYDYIWQQYMVGLGVSANLILGEALALDTPIPTPSGWTTMGELRVGDEVFSRDGSVTKVIAKSPIWEGRPTYSVKMDGADALIADENHKWVVGRYHTQKSDTTPCGSESIYSEEVLKTSDLLKRKLVNKSGQCLFRVPTSEILDLPPKSLPVPPYTLGAWLGDGDTRGHGTFTCHDKDVQIVENIRKDGFSVSKRVGSYAWGIRGLRKLLRKAGLLSNKHIPSDYLRASFPQRLALAQGLLDTDGYCSVGGCCSFDNTNYGLVSSLRELLLTLGIKPSPIAVKLDGRKDSYLPMYRFTFTVGDGQPIPFRLDRKVKRTLGDSRSRGTTQKTGKRTNRRYIHSVDLIPSAPTVCIQVDHPSGTFLAGRDFIVTHNSGIFSSAETSSNQAFVRARKKDRDRLEDWMTYHFFEPLATWNNIRFKKGNALVPILPEYEWEKTLDYTAEEQEREDTKWLWEKGVFPTKSLLGKLRYNPDEIEKGLASEINTVFDDGKRIAAPAVRKSMGGDQTKPGAGGLGGPLGESPLGGEPGGGGGGPLGGPGGGGPGGGPEPAGIGNEAGGPPPAEAGGAAPGAGGPPAGGPEVTEAPPGTL